MMMRSVLSHSLTYGTTTIAARGASVVALVILPYILRTTDYGVVAMLALANVLVGAIVPLQITQGFARSYSVADESERRALATSAWRFTWGSTLLFLVAAILLADPIAKLLLGDSGYVPILRIGLAVMAGNNIFFFIQQALRWQMRTGAYAIVTLAYAFATLSLSVGFGALLANHLFGVVLGQLIAAWGAVLIGWFLLRGSFGGRFDTTRFRDMLYFSLPLVPAALFIFLLNYAGRIALKGVSTLDQVGIYTFAWQVAALAGLAVIGIQSALSPLIMAHYRDPGTPGTVGKLFEAFVAVALLLSIGLGLFTSDLLAIANYGPDYRAGGSLIILIAPALLMTETYIFFPGFFIAKRTLRQMIVSGFAAAIALVLAYVLASGFGIVGAAFASLLSSALFLGLWIGFSQPLYRIPVRWPLVALAVGIAASAGAAGLLVDVGTPVEQFLFKLFLFLAAAAAMLAGGLFPIRFALSALRRKVGGKRSLFTES